MQTHMTANVGKATAKRKPSQAKEPDTPRKKARKDAVVARQASLRKMKALMDKALTECSTLKGDIGKLATKGYPPQMTTWCEERIAAMIAHVTKSQEVYGEEANQNHNN